MALAQVFRPGLCGPSLALAGKQDRFCLPCMKLDCIVMTPFDSRICCILKFVTDLLDGVPWSKQAYIICKRETGLQPLPFQSHQKRR